MSDNIERKIAEAVIDGILAAGFTITVNDEDTGHGEDVVKLSTDKAEILAAMWSTDGDLMKACQGDKCFGWVRFVWGNDQDCICDHTTNMEPMLAAANKLAEEYA